MLGANDQSGSVTTGPWASRDGYIAETAIKFDRMQAKLERLERTSDTLRQRLSELGEGTEQSARFQAFEESLRNAREYKLDELVRCTKEIKARLDQHEGNRSAYNGLTHKSFEAVDGKLVELTQFQNRMQALERAVLRNTLLFGGAMLLLAATVLARFG